MGREGFPLRGVFEARIEKNSNREEIFDWRKRYTLRPIGVQAGTGSFLRNEGGTSGRTERGPRGGLPGLVEYTKGRE